MCANARTPLDHRGTSTQRGGIWVVRHGFEDTEPAACLPLGCDVSTRLATSVEHAVPVLTGGATAPC